MVSWYSEIYQESTVSNCCHEITSYLKLEIFLVTSKFKGLVWGLSGAVFLLREWALGGYRKWDDTLECCLALSKYALKQAEEILAKDAEERSYDKRLFRHDNIQLMTLIMSSKILENLTNPNDAVVSCLRLQHQFHELFFPLKYEIFFRYVSRMNRVLFEFAKVVIKPPPTAENWPVTVKFDERIVNPEEIPKRVRKEIFRPNYLDDILETTGNRYKFTIFMIFIKQTMKRTNEWVSLCSFMFNFPFSSLFGF